jgi:replicative DNA helicase
VADLLTPQGLVLAGCLPAEIHRTARVVGLPRDAFNEGVDRGIFDALVLYWNKYRAVLPTQTLSDRLKDLPDAQRADVATRWVRLINEDVPDDQFEWARVAVWESWREAEAQIALARAGQMMLGGTPVVRDGKEVVLRGYESMRSFITTELSRIDGHDITEGQAEADLREEYDAILADYGSGRSGTVTPLGIDVIDENTAGGLRAGDFVLIAGYAGEGKTLFAISVAVYSAILRGQNVVYFTGETLRNTVRRRLVVRHTRAPQFQCPGGVNIMAVRTGELSQGDLNVYQSSALDLTNNPAYGHLLISQMPIGMTFDKLHEHLRSTEQQWPVHMVVVDSIDMVRGQSRYGTARENLNEVIDLFESLAVSYAGGRGITVVSPYQINRTSYLEAVQNQGRYTLAALAETAQAERRASLIFSLLRLPDAPGRVSAQILKNREGPPAEFTLSLDDSSAYIGMAPGQTRVADSIGSLTGL